MSNPKTICMACKKSKLTLLGLVNGLWEMACNHKGVWNCPSKLATFPKLGEGEEPRYDMNTLEYPPQWCLWRVELLMLKEKGHKCPERVMFPKL